MNWFQLVFHDSGFAGFQLVFGLFYTLIWVLVFHGSSSMYFCYIVCCLLYDLVMTDSYVWNMQHESLCDYTSTRTRVSLL